METDLYSIFESTTEYLFEENFTINSINDTVDIKNPTVKTQLLIYDFLIPTIGGLIIITNFLVVLSSGLILKKGQQPRSTYLFLGNVAMTDLVTGIAVVFGQVFPKDSRDHYVCALQIGMIVSSTLTSVYSVGLIAVDRFLYILHGMKYQRWVYPQRARMLIALTWVIGCVIGYLPLMGWYGNTDNGRICWFILLAPKSLVLLTVLMGIIPLLVVLVLYSIILYHALKKIIQLQHADRQRNNPNPNNGEESTTNIRIFRGKTSNATSETEDDVNQSEEKGILKFFKKKPSSTVKSPNKWKAIKVVLFTTGSFVVTWSPYFIVSLLYVYKCEKDSDTKNCKTLRLLIASPLAILGFMNSFINPIIYAWWHKGFRSFVKKRITVLFMKKSDNGNLQQSSSQTKSTRKDSTTSSSANVGQVNTNATT